MTSTDVTVIQSSADLPLGSLGDQLADAGLRVRVVRADQDEPLPAADGLGAALIVLDGRMSPYDDAATPWLAPLRELVLAAATAGVPTLAIGLGAQLLAVAGGGQVTVDAPPGPETGPVRVFWRPEAMTDPVLGDLARSVAQAGERASLVPSMHAHAVSELPDGALWLASSNMYPFHAFRVGSALGVQFRAETSADVLASWLEVEDLAGGADVRETAERMARTGQAVVAGLVAAVRAPLALV
ncbi:GMP synthase-Glutamine amidotransferase [Sanguibacter gelidistatuariae]|uniref:GMP synthase-Glutamine amidotransferase n=1 Tax=Sanguibacter gelidistatuariae TaxID=1814289 RepID=A0A1G6PTK4_9MICO|nr:type 1 glutamine amidotransferase [Sanguibacter gelidistatuariae]SDC83409.1 GMP synthase-Glutamine amidotransferase [Sanguibacter gelidistatuariae]